MTTTFYAPPSSIRAGRVALPEAEAEHAARALRKQPGDEVVVVDGAGGWHDVRLDHVGRQSVMGTILQTQREVGEPRYRLTVGLALLKNRSRFETFLEKAVELGVRRVVPLQTERTVKGSLKMDRAQNILVAAMKQSGRSRLPDLTEPKPLGRLLSHTSFGAVAHRDAFVCHEAAAPEDALTQHLPADLDGRSVLVLIGPEGGFAPDEISRAQQAGCRVVSLGPRRLRAETAAMTVCTALMLADK